MLRSGSGYAERVERKEEVDMPIYGIDLGTTNSLIGHHSAGFLSEIVPSCVDLSTGAAGKDYYNSTTATRSFKVDMSIGTEGIKPRLASTYVLNALKEKAPGPVEDVVISVPAYFSDSQRQATVEAAVNAGMNVRALVNEPTAASMYIAQDKKGLFAVYDLGGGTFDCSIIDSRFGAFDVQATDGCKIGGDNFDINIMRYFLKNGRIPIQQLNKEARFEIQHYATRVKVLMQKERKTQTVDLTPWGGIQLQFTPEVYVSLMKLTFAETINCMKRLLAAWIPTTEVYEILLVGGSTHCPYLREWIMEVTGQAPAPLTYDPDRVVAQGAALYADLLERGVLHTAVSDVTKQLGIGMWDGTVSVVVPANSKVPLSLEKMFTNNEESDKLELDLYQGQGALTRENECIGTLVYEYGYVQPPRSGQVIVNISIDMSGIITLTAKSLLGNEQAITLRRHD